ncbi:hypothetical protein ABEB36_005161 [Hypothenemus hampei]|uniref:Uncharacterized protein n=1 Tax=Hypothenemus hampei TaxID=57062 RepID=A0ABD1F085_HYPHA
MSSRALKKNIKVVSKNFEKYTEAMEEDLEVLITSILAIIEAKIGSLHKLLKLKMYIKKAKSIATGCVTETDDFTINSSLVEKENGSLEDLSSTIYEVDKNSLPEQDNSQTQKKNNCSQNIESLCSLWKERELVREILEKYIYMLYDAEKKPKDKYETSDEIENKKTQIGDHSSNIKFVSHRPLQMDGIYLGRSEYDSILDILNMILNSLKAHDMLERKCQIIEKSKTEMLICANSPDERKILSDSVCQQKNRSEDKKIKRKYSCV